MFYASFSENFDGLKGEGRVHRVFEEIAEFQDRRGWQTFCMKFVLDSSMTGRWMAWMCLNLKCIELRDRPLDLWRALGGIELELS